MAAVAYLPYTKKQDMPGLYSSVHHRSATMLWLHWNCRLGLLGMLVENIVHQQLGDTVDCSCMASTHGAYSLLALVIRHGILLMLITSLLSQGSSRSGCSCSDLNVHVGSVNTFCSCCQDPLLPEYH